MNYFLLAALLISSLAIVHADPADDQLLAELAKKFYTNVSVMRPEQKQALKDAMRAGAEVTENILNQFSHVIYFTTDVNGVLLGGIQPYTGVELKFKDAVPSGGSADNVFIKSAEGFVGTLAETYLVNFLKSDRFKACVASGVTNGGNYNHIVAFTPE